jgi:hypothetical protein
LTAAVTVICLAAIGLSVPHFTGSHANARAQASAGHGTAGHGAKGAGGAAPAAPGVGTASTAAGVCGDPSLLTGPGAAPPGAVTIPAGLDSGTYDSPGTTYYFATGTHTLGPGPYQHIEPATGDTYIGAPGAVLSGQWVNNAAFVGTASGVTIEDLTVEFFDPPGGQGAVNHDSGEGWTIEGDTLEHNAPGAALMVGTDDTVKGSCLTANGEYGFDAYATTDVSSVTGGPSNVMITGNEISDNNTCNWEDVSPDPVPAAEVPADCPGTAAGQFDGCGCAGGGKFWQVDGATVTDNDVDDNFDVGLWADTDNTGFGVDADTFSGNWGPGWQEEASYNFSITGDTFSDNGWGAGASNSGFPTGAVYISESGGDARVPGPYSGTALVSGNSFKDNWGGVVLWENSNRFCSDGSDGVCTLVDPSVFTRASCAANLPTTASSGDPDYFDGCRWRTQNVRVTHNVFELTQSKVPGCELATNSCGQNALFSEYGSNAPYEGWVVPLTISDHQDDRFADNTYEGPWSFVAFNQGDRVTWAQWTGGFEDWNGSGDSFGAQDAGSTYHPGSP